MRSVILTHGADVAGVAIGLKRAADRAPEAGLEIRSVARGSNYLQYPADVSWRDRRTVLELFAAADVAHLTNGPFLYGRLAQQTGHRPPGLVHHHGHRLRRYPLRAIQEARRRRFTLAVSTLDLTLRAPRILHWLPSPVAVDELELIRAEHRRDPDGRILIATAPTRRAIKSTDAIIAAVLSLRAGGLPVELDVIERVSHHECLRRKARADLYFDQLHLGYGVNALEAWAMGIPVIAGADSPIIGRMRAEFDGRIPFYQATIQSLREAVIQLVESEDLRLEWAAAGRAHILRHHADGPVLERLSELYRLTLHS